MFNKSRVVSLIVAVLFVFVLAGLAAQQATTQKKAPENTQEVIVCQVCGMKIDKAQSPITWDYKGKTYYFCSQACKAEFMKNPESFLKEKPEGKAEAKAVYVCPMCKDVKSDKPGKCPRCGKDMVKAEPGKDVFYEKVLFQGPEPGQGRMMMYGPFMGYQPMKGECPMMMGRGMTGERMRPGWAMMMKGVDFKVDYTKDGAVITLTSKDPDTVKIIQGHVAMMKKRAEEAAREPMIKKEVIIKEETKKETVK